MTNILNVKTNILAPVRCLLWHSQNSTCSSTLTLVSCHLGLYPKSLLLCTCMFWVDQTFTILLIFVIVGIILKGEDACKTCTDFLKMKDEKKKECFGDKSISVSEMSRLSQWSYALRQVQINEWAVCW